MVNKILIKKICKAYELGVSGKPLVGRPFPEESYAHSLGVEIASTQPPEEKVSGGFFGKKDEPKDVGWPSFIPFETSEIRYEMLKGSPTLMTSRIGTGTIDGDEKIKMTYKIGD